MYRRVARVPRFWGFRRGRVKPLTERGNAEPPVDFISQAPLGSAPLVVPVAWGVVPSMGWQRCEHVPKGEPMSNHDQRRFTLLDGMIFVAATGVALGWERVYLNYLHARFVLVQLPGYILINFYLLGSIPFLVIYALVLLARSLRTFRLPMHRMARRPGIVACFAIMLGVGVAVFCMLARLALSAFVQTSMRKVNFLEIAGMFTQRIWISGSFVAVPGWPSS